MMLSVIATRDTPCASNRRRSSRSTRSGDFSRIVMPWPLSPQNVQWLFCPHQQPRLVSYARCTVPRPAAHDAGVRNHRAQLGEVVAVVELGQAVEVLARRALDDAGQRLAAQEPHERLLALAREHVIDRGREMRDRLAHLAFAVRA